MCDVLAFALVVMAFIALLVFMLHFAAQYQQFPAPLLVQEPPPPIYPPPPMRESAQPMRQSEDRVRQSEHPPRPDDPPPQSESSDSEYGHPRADLTPHFLLPISAE